MKRKKKLVGVNEENTDSSLEFAETRKPLQLLCCVALNKNKKKKSFDSKIFVHDISTWFIVM